MTGPPRHASPYPTDGNGGTHDPRPWWFRDFEARVMRELEELTDAVRLLNNERQQRRGIVITGRTIAAGVMVLAGLGTIIGLAVALVAGGGT